MEQRTPEWFEARKGRVTGSRIGTILGLNPYQTKAQLIREMVRELKGAPSEFVTNEHIQRGIDNEAASLFSLSMETNINFEEVGFIEHAEHEWIGVSPDGLSEDCGAEIKNPVKPQPIETKPQYEAQIRLCMECCGVDHWYYMSDPVEGSPVIQIIERDPEWFPSVLPALQDFMAELDKEVDNPAHLEPLVQERTDDAFIKAAMTYRRTQALLNNAREEAEAARKELLSLTDKSCVGGGVAVAVFERKGNIQYSKVPQLEGIDLEQYRGKPSTQFRITEVA